MRGVCYVLYDVPSIDQLSQPSADEKRWPICPQIPYTSLTQALDPTLWGDGADQADIRLLLTSRRQ